MHPPNIVRMYVLLDAATGVDAATGNEFSAATAAGALPPAAAWRPPAPKSAAAAAGLKSMLARGRVGRTLARALERGRAQGRRDLARACLAFGPAGVATVAELRPRDVGDAGDGAVLLRDVLPPPEDLQPPAAAHLAALKRREFPTPDFPGVTCKLAFAGSRVSFDLQWLGRKRIPAEKRGEQVLKSTHTRPRLYVAPPPAS